MPTIHEIALDLGYTLHPRKWGDASRAQLQGVLPELVSIATLAIQICEFDGTIVGPGGGLRTPEQAQQNVENGTGILNSLHRVQPSGKGYAIDLAPYPIDWNDLPRFQKMADCVEVSAAIHEFPIRQGKVWGDWAHFEKPKQQYIEESVLRMYETRKRLGLLS